jgi:anion transporter
MQKHIDKIGGALFVLLALILILAKPFSPELSAVGHTVLGGFLITIGIWIFKPFKLTFSMGGFFLSFWLLAQKIPPAVVFSGFTQGALWTLIPALFFGHVLQKTGLGKRIALGIIKVFKPSWPSILLALALIGVILSILTPSMTVRVLIVLPIAVQCCELFGLEKKSKGNSLILLTAFAMALLPGAGWLTGTLTGPVLMGMYNAVPAMQDLVTFDSWFKVLFIPMEIVSVLLVVGGYFVLKPEAPLSKDAIETLKNQKAEPLSREEKAAGLILVGVFAFFVTNRFHGIPDAAVCIAAVVCFYSFGVLNAGDFGTGISWDLVMFNGFALGLAAVFSATGISAWLSGIIVPALAPLAASPWLFIFVIIIMVFIWRFFDIANLVPTYAFLIPILPAMQEAYRISPLVWLLVFVMAVNAFFMAYQNMWAIMSVSIAKDRAWTAKHQAGYGLLYFVACLVALLVAVPLFIKAGFLD